MKEGIEARIGLEQRLNLQTISHFIYDGSTLQNIDYNAFQLREDIISQELKNTITDLCGVEMVEELVDVVENYFEIKDSIYFELGMKAGATLQVNLLRNFDND